MQKQLAGLNFPLKNVSTSTSWPRGAVTLFALVLIRLQLKQHDCMCIHQGLPECAGVQSGTQIKLKKHPYCVFNGICCLLVSVRLGKLSMLYFIWRLKTQLVPKSA